MTRDRSATMPLPSARETPVGAEALAGLTADPKTMSPWLFYDDRGSALFERITELPEYYLTRTERAIFAAHGGEIVREAAGDERLALVELGAGTASKTGLLLRAATAQQGTVDYHAIDVSASALEEARRNLEGKLPGVRVHARVADYTDGLGTINVDGARKLVLYIGSSIGNFEPDAATTLLQGVRDELALGDRLLLGADQVKAPELLLAAYDDAQGVTAAFNMNVLRRLNRELGADFELACWRHQARWSSDKSRIEMHLSSAAEQVVHLPGLDLTVRFAEGETIHTESSYKFTDARINAMFVQAGFILRRTWKDGRGWFGVYLAEAV